MSQDANLEARVQEAIKIQAQEQPDMCFISEEGAKIPAHRVILSLYSPFLSELISNVPQHLTPCFSLPECKKKVIMSTLSICYRGNVASSFGDDVELLHQIQYCSNLLGFKLEGIQTKDQLMDKNEFKSSSFDVIDKSRTGISSNAEGISNPDTDDSKEYKENGNTNISSGLVHICQLCEFKSELSKNLLKHYSVHHFHGELNRLTDSYFELDSLTGHYKPCKVCKKVIEQNKGNDNNAPKDILIHIGVIHMKIIDILRTNKMKVPNFHKDAISSGILSSSLMNKFSCSLCISIQFSTKTELNDHLSSVHFCSELVGEFGQQQTKTCNVCNHKFQSLLQLSKHIGTIHNKVEEMYAKKCETQESNKYDDSLNCFICKSEFSERQALRKHLSSLHFMTELTEKYGSYGTQCSLCFAWLHSKDDLAIHIGDFHSKLDELINKGQEKSQVELNDSQMFESTSSELLMRKILEKSNLL